MITITLSSFKHKNTLCTGIHFGYNFETKEYIKRGPHVIWTQTHRCFYIVSSEQADAALTTYLKAGNFKIIRKRQQTATLTKLHKLKNTAYLSKEKKIVFKQFISFLRGKRFSESTVKTYANFVFDFLAYTKQKPIEVVDAEDVRLFMQWTVGTLNYAVSTHRQMVSGLRHFAYFYPACAIHPDKIFMPRKDKKLPIVLSNKEIMALLVATPNLKHRVILSMLYGSGLRIGELLSLQLKDFDFHRNQLYVRNAKGRKDRYVSLSTALKPLLKNYYASFTPQQFFIESPKGGMYSATAIRSFLKRSCKRAGISKHVTPHTLRHSYATHLLEQGTDIRYIQELLGHSKPETTMVYTHVATKELQQIKSPLDCILKPLSLPNTDTTNPLIS